MLVSKVYDKNHKMMSLQQKKVTSHMGIIFPYKKCFCSAPEQKKNEMSPTQIVQKVN
jgi:hypothetical protein